jgi:hypothetical protein
MTFPPPKRASRLLWPSPTGWNLDQRSRGGASD